MSEQETRAVADASAARPPRLEGRGASSHRLEPGQQLLAGDRLVPAHGKTQLVMQEDGNLACYDSAGRPFWATGTDVAGSYVVLQDDANLVVYSPGGAALWSSRTHRRWEPLGYDTGDQHVDTGKWMRTWAQMSSTGLISGHTHIWCPAPARPARTRSGDNDREGGGRPNSPPGRSLPEQPSHEHDPSMLTTYRRSLKCLSSNAAEPPAWSSAPSPAWRRY